MTTDDERDEPELRDLLSKRAEVRDGEVDDLRGFVASLPAKRRRRPSLGLLAAAAGITVVLGSMVVFANFQVRTGTARPAFSAPEPSAFATDPRLAVCNATSDDAVAIFELRHLSDYATQLPNAYPLVGLQADPAAPALVIVFKGPGTPERGGETPAPNAHDVCLVVGADKASWQHVGVANVDTSGLIAEIPEPTGTPIATDELPWVERCGGVEAGINRILHLPHGTDAMTLNSVAVPQSAMSADPMTIIVYDGAHPFPPQGTQPPAGVTFEPRNAPKPGENDLCILSGADPTTAKRTVVEYGTQIEVGPPPSQAPSPSTSPSGSPAPSQSPVSILRHQIDPADCAALGFSDARCMAVVEQAITNAGVDWSQVASVQVVAPPSSLTLGSKPIAEVRFTLLDGTTAKSAAYCGLGSQYSLVCTETPQIQMTTPLSGYHDIPCGDVPAGDPGAACATPLPTINPTAESVPLIVASLDHQLVMGHQEILVGQATLPNGILSDASFSLLDPATKAFTVDGAVALVIRPVDPAGKPFDNAYAHGWQPGSEVVNVYLVLDVTSMKPDAMLNVRNLVVR